MVFNATFNNISVILWQSVLLVEETEENHWSVASHWQTLSHNVLKGVRTYMDPSIFFAAVPLDLGLDKGFRKSLFIYIVLILNWYSQKTVSLV
jgi:hypothetical protein